MKHVSLEKFERFSSSEKLLKLKLHPKMTHCCEALKPCLPTIFYTKQVHRGTFFYLAHSNLNKYTNL